MHVKDTLVDFEKEQANAATISTRTGKMERDKYKRYNKSKRKATMSGRKSDHKLLNVKLSYKQATRMPSI